MPGCYALSVQAELPNVCGTAVGALWCCHVSSRCRRRRCSHACRCAPTRGESFMPARLLQHIEDILENRGIKWRLPD